ncbi:hypothetical protein [Hydrogenivirga sp. 128-5-R1-1]|uniref:hypothetical protein n=1 Tax=Hydrogenivirga sp. 128-5-R1-1 TaxID=392423 RepID=UPI00015F0C45|nr:hypothetical protein [Hydrogenivirga sp. 128-5-R1-1]EDP75949.1 tRNA 2-selenouridine synthase [Hydrogenivirga sp. 128-5-R1-1]
MVKLLLFVLVVGFSFGITEEEFRKDREYLKRVEKRLDEIDRVIQRRGARASEIDELNSYGYPLNKLMDKYMRESEDKYEDFSLKISKVYDRVLFVKRGAFPSLLREEIESLQVPICSVRAEGSRRETITIVMEDPEDEEDVLKVMTETQLRYAHLLGIENVRFEKCR